MEGVGLVAPCRRRARREDEDGGRMKEDGGGRRAEGGGRRVEGGGWREDGGRTEGGRYDV